MKKISLISASVCFLFLLQGGLSTNAKEPFDSTTLVRPPSNFDSVYSNFVGSNSAGSATALKAELSGLQKQQDDVDVQGNQKAAELKVVDNLIQSHNDRINSYNARCQGGQPEPQYSSCVGEQSSLNAAADNLNYQRDSIIQELTTLKNQWDDIENKKVKIEADLRNLEQFASQSQSCKGLSTEESMYDCLKNLWEGNK